MRYKGFIEGLTAYLQERLGTGYMFIPNESLGMNGKVRHSLIVKNEGSNISPCICLNELYQEYAQGKTGIEHVAEKVLKVYRENEIHGNIDADYLMDWNQVKQWIRCRLVNTEKNMVLLAGMPHREILDLSVVYYVQIALSGGTAGIVHINNEYMKLWDVDEGILYDEAWKNMREADDAEYDSIANVIGRSLGIEVQETGLPGKQIYVLSNQKKLYGAVYMLNQDKMMKIAEDICSDLWIIPSSVHESIIIPSGRNEHAAELAQIVREINDTELSEDEVLSCHVYHFSRKNGEISIAA